MGVLRHGTLITTNAVPALLCTQKKLTAQKAAAYRRKSGIVISNEDDQQMLLDEYITHTKWARERWGEDSVGFQLWMDHINTMQHAKKHNGSMVGVKHSPVMIKVCLLMRSQLSKPVYNTIARLMLWPLDQSLSSYKNAMVTKTPGFLHAVVQEKSLQLVTGDASDVHKGCLSFDAMTVKSGMAFDYQTGKLLGVCADGKHHTAVAREVDYMREAEKHMHGINPNENNDTDETMPLIKYHVVAYFRSIGTSAVVHCFPVATFQSDVVRLCCVYALPVQYMPHGSDLVHVPCVCVCVCSWMAPQS